MSYKQRYRLARNHGWSAEKSRAYAKKGTKKYGRAHRRGGLFGKLTAEYHKAPIRFTNKDKIKRKKLAWA